MQPGVYIVSPEEKILVATLDDILYGDRSTIADISQSIISVLRDAVSNLVYDLDDPQMSTLAILIVS
jgi:hypothetical protein